MKALKKVMLASMAALALLSSSCGENFKKMNGNEMVEGARTFNYALVVSQITGNSYYHISGWKEYGPDGSYVSGGELGCYVGIELQLAVSKDVVYYYEPNLMYVMSKEYNIAWEKLAGGKMVE